MNSSPAAPTAISWPSPHEVVALLSGGRDKDRVIVESGGAIIAASVDRDLISRVLQNLLGNAFKFSPSGTVKVHLKGEREGIHVEVIDQGPGIPVEHHERIFQKFGQVEGLQQRVGTGLGLTFCRLAVEAHGGTIGVRSEVGKGSSFWFDLPHPTA
ncbi:MAG: ATP-binding protein [Chthoniobacter sp.]